MFVVSMPASEQPRARSTPLLLEPNREVDGRAPNRPPRIILTRRPFVPVVRSRARVTTPIPPAPIFSSNCLVRPTAAGLGSGFGTCPLVELAVAAWAVVLQDSGGHWRRSPKTESS